MSEPVLSKSKIEELRALLLLYYKQAMLCQKSEAYLPGCIMLGSCLETLLLMIATGCNDHANPGGTQQQTGFI
jgi:hypothetical protein